MQIGEWILERKVAIGYWKLNWKSTIGDCCAVDLNPLRLRMRFPRSQREWTASGDHPADQICASSISAHDPNFQLPVSNLNFPYPVSNFLSNIQFPLSIFF